MWRVRCKRSNKWGEGGERVEKWAAQLHATQHTTTATHHGDHAFAFGLCGEPFLLLLLLPPLLGLLLGLEPLLLLDSRLLLLPRSLPVLFLLPRTPVLLPDLVALLLIDVEVAMCKEIGLVNDLKRRIILVG